MFRIIDMNDNDKNDINSYLLPLFTEWQSKSSISKLTGSRVKLCPIKYGNKKFRKTYKKSKPNRDSILILLYLQFTVQQSK